MYVARLDQRFLVSEGGDSYRYIIPSNDTYRYYTHSWIVDNTYQVRYFSHTPIIVVKQGGNDRRYL